MGRVFLQRNRRRRLEQGHPWIYQTEVARVEGNPQPGDLVDVYNHQGVFLARGYINPRSQILVRVLTYNSDEAIDVGFFVRRLEQAKRHRERFLADTSSCRMVYGEADFLPGLIVDKFGDVLVVQLLTYGMDVRRDLIREALIEVFRPRGIYLRNDVPVRELEGLAQEKGVWYGEVPRWVEIVENGLTFVVDVHEGQKTGYFFDQRENRAAIAPLMTGWGESGRDGAEVLECFCHTGAFTVHAAHYGAKHITAVDISEDAIAVAKENVARNGYADRVTFRVANAFDELRRLDAEGARFDVVILDPPAFAKNRQAVESACRGYKEINLRAMRILRDGGYLVTASCSYHVSRERFMATIADAALDTHKILRLVEFRSAGKDHPVIHGAGESAYLKFAIFEVRSRK
ncbi:MAG TPA: class I SAM-dependent rRNA methyltransferase [Calditerricola sp.]